MDVNLLTDAWCDVDLVEGGQRQLTLPELFSAMQADQVLGFNGLIAHQAHFWHAFLCQLAALALEDQELAPPDPNRLVGQDDTHTWLQRLRALTLDWPQDEPWRLVVERADKPAFMQPPSPNGDLAAYTSKKNTPDDIDILITSKCHGVKQSVVTAPQAQHWVFALISMQTGAGYSAAGSKVQYHPNSRQNGSYAARPGVGLIASERSGAQWARDTCVMLSQRDWFHQQGIPYSPTGIKLMWLEPWDGAASLDLKQLHPWFLETSRRIRLRALSGGNFEAFLAGTKAPRIAAKEQNGVMADPWTPIKNDEPLRALNSRPRYGVVQEILFDAASYHQTPLQKPQPWEHQGLALRLRILVRGQGKTEGYEERLIPIPAKARNYLLGGQRDEAAELAKAMVSLVSDSQWKVLKPALLQLLQPANDYPDSKQRETSLWANTWLNKADQEVDLHFFHQLWLVLVNWETQPSESRDVLKALEPWRSFLRQLVQENLAMAEQALPSSGAQHFRAVAKARRLLGWAMNKHLPLEQGERK